MLKFQWNALHVGDRVDVHDPEDASMRLVPGIVTMVQSRSGANDIGILLDATVGVAGAPGTPAHVVRPARLAVHLDATDAGRGCWRCADAEHPAVPAGAHA